MEDEFLIAMDIEQVCRDHGASECIIAPSLSDAGRAVGFDIAVIDLRLSGESTLDYARNLRERGIPFVFATGYSDLEQMKTEFAEVPVVEKPYGEDELINMLVTALQGSSESTSGG